MNIGLRPIALCMLVAVAALIATTVRPLARIPPAGSAQDDYDVAVPHVVRGPFVSHPLVIGALDCGLDCPGSLTFARLIQARLPNAGLSHDANPFMHGGVSDEVRDTVIEDLGRLRKNANAVDGQLSTTFLTDPGSKVELVGVINRMDRQFIKDPTQRHTQAQRDCGEISLVYRFSYSIRNGTQKSRLPVTMNLVFPALPSDTQDGRITCQMIAKRWVDFVTTPPTGSPGEQAARMRDPAFGPLAFIDGRDIERLELNMQAYRISAGSDSGVTDMGTKAEYLIRIFQWNEQKKRFTARFLNNQIDRARLLCTDSAPTLDCAENARRRQALVAYLQRPEVVASVDAGTLDLPLDLGDDSKGLRNDVLALQASSVSPGGSHRSGNQPYWKADRPEDQIISDAEIKLAIDRALKAGEQLSFIKSEDDFRTRLNETTCTGCHQTRAIAGFHFPGTDRLETPAVNAVFLPGSPHFYGDQARRMEILERMAKSPKTQNQRQLATSYAARPQGTYTALRDNTELIGGWGGACLTPEVMTSSRRKWTCKSDAYECVQVFKSNNDPGIGTCVPKTKLQVGDPLQRGRIVTRAFGQDRYFRKSPTPVADDTRILTLPTNPPRNTFYGAHQEYYPGNPKSDDRDIRRDAQTGGFPGGMLRLSECIDLPGEATCGLIASSGFNDCIAAVARNDTTLDKCFLTFTSYAGIRACDASRPCRDDYICVKPMGYTKETTHQSFLDRREYLKSTPLFSKITKRAYSEADHGQQEPDTRWIEKNGRSGMCIPPYFVFQFRSDSHPAPPGSDSGAPSRGR